MHTLDCLEARRFLSVSAYLSQHSLYVVGDSAANNLRLIMLDANTIAAQQYVSGVGFKTLYSRAVVGPPNTPVITSTIVLLGGGADTFVIDNAVKISSLVYGGNGADTLQGGGGTNDLWGDDRENPRADDGADDVLIGGSGYNYLHGQRGNDTLYCQKNSYFLDTQQDQLYGGSGNDTFILNGTGDAKVFAYGEDGLDKFKIGAHAQPADISGGTGYDTVDFSSYIHPLYVKPDGVTPSGNRLDFHDRKVIVDFDNEAVIGTTQNDQFDGSSASNTFYGGKGNDLMYGFDGADILLGGDGNDSLYGGGGDNYIAGEAGNDVIGGGSGNDKLLGGDGNDSIKGYIGNDSIEGNAGNDSLFGEDGNDTIVGGTGQDLLVGGAGSDKLDSHDGTVLNDVLFGGNQDHSGNYSGNVDVARIDATSSAFHDLYYDMELVTT